MRREPQRGHIRRRCAENAVVDEVAGTRANEPEAWSLESRVFEAWSLMESHDEA
jgi:hypothetical protein